MISFIKNKISSENKKYFAVIAIFALINIILLTTAIHKFVSPFISDSYEYQETAKYLVGHGGAEIFPHRLLKPLAPLLFGLGSFFVDIKASFLFVNSVFYFFIGFLIFKITDLIFSNKRQALISSIIFLSAYPMLEYGVSYMTDLSGWFFFALSVYLTLLFLKKPGHKLAALNGFVSALGMLCKESGGMGALFFTLCVFFALQESLSKKLKYFFVYVFSFLAPFFLWQFFVYLRFHYSYYDWFLFNRGAGNKVYKNEIIKLVVKSLGASFLFGWIFAIYGTIKLYLAKEITGKTKIIIAFLIPSSISFLLWFAASSRLFYIIGVLLSLFAGYGIISLVGNKYLQTGFVSAVLFVNYFWLIFDDKFRAVMNYFFNVHY